MQYIGMLSIPSFPSSASWLSGRGVVPNVLAMSNVFTSVHNFPATPADFRFPAFEATATKQVKVYYISTIQKASQPASQPANPMKPGKSIKCNCMANDPYNLRPPKTQTQTGIPTRTTGADQASSWPRPAARNSHRRTKDEGSLRLSVIVPNYKLFRIYQGANDAPRRRLPLPAINFVQRQLNGEWRTESNRWRSWSSSTRSRGKGGSASSRAKAKRII